MTLWRNDNIANLVNEIKAFCLVNKMNCMSPVGEEISYQEVIEALGNIAGQMEQRIQQEHEKAFVTDDVERDFMRFACTCMEYILDEYDQSKQFRPLAVKLFAYRHYGYAFFVKKDEEYHMFVLGEDNKLRDGEKTELLGKYQDIYKTAYMSLAEFYNRFFGRFVDNETAVKLLCRYFISDVSFDEDEQEKIIDGLISHIRYAGDSGDFGYAYHGLEMINRYIGNLPIYLIHKLLKRYSNGDVEGRIRYRKQIFAIISNVFPQQELEKYKFLYLDSVLIVEALRDIYNEEKKSRGEAFVNFYPLSEMPVNQELITVEDSEKNEYELFLDSENGKRVFRKPNGEVIFEVFVEKQLFTHNMVIFYRGKRHTLKNELEMEGTLSVYNRRFYLNLKEVMISNKANNYISFKLIYLNNYHGMKQQKFYFDQCFGYEDGAITYDETVKTELPLSYSSRITSIHAIVGKNGTGKTSIVNFLGNDFINIMFELEEKGATISDILAKYENMQGVEFLVVFELDDKLYYLSNIDIVQAPEKVKQYELSTAGSVKRALSKVFYFSNKVDINDVFEPNRKETNRKEKEELHQDMEVWGTKNYSEQRSLDQRIYRQKEESIRKYDTNSIEDMQSQVFNKDLFYQLLFLRDHFDDGCEKLKELLWDNFSIADLTLGESQKDELVQAFIRGREKEVNGWQNIFYEKRALRYFSSGQYARFNFQAKMYWITKGYSDNQELLEELGVQKIFFGSEVIEEGDSAMIFIDEGDLYYHPEWQRQYISDLCRIIEEESVNYKLQIIIATNSPFILSDIFEKNIIFLSDKEEDRRSSEIKQTFGQNIHTLLKKDFFMNYTIGEFAREKIVQIFRMLESQQYTDRVKLASEVARILKIDVSPEEVYEQLYYFANSIGEDVYRRHIVDLIEQHIKNDLNVRINYLKKRQKEIEEELQLLEKEEKHDYDKNEDVR